MNKKLGIILISIVLLVVISLISFYFINKNTDSLNTSVNSENEVLENIKKENQKALENSKTVTPEEKEQTNKELNQIEKDLANLAKGY